MSISFGWGLARWRSRVEWETSEGPSPGVNFTASQAGRRKVVNSVYEPSHGPKTVVDVTYFTQTHSCHHYAQLY
jgi:hypothetical protein